MTGIRPESSGPWAGVATPFLACGRERNRRSRSGQRFALRLRRRLSCAGPSIPFPRARFLEPNTARPGLGGFGGVVGISTPPQPEGRFGAQAGMTYRSK